MQLERIRNLSIVAHVDHGKSTLSDRILELTGAVDARDMREQYLDSMDIERERGITIKAQNVRVHWKGFTIHLIDTPGHVDFGYEVSRSLAACEGVVLLVDAAQGIEAQTLANAYQALEHDLEIVAALNKIDLPAADPDRYAAEIEHVLGVPAGEILRISAKTGEGVPELLDAICERIPPPVGDPDAALQGLIFDSYYDQYRGVVSAVRVVNGTLASGGRLRFMQTGSSPRRRGDRGAHPAQRAGRPRSARARSATSSPASRTWARPAVGRPSPMPPGRRRRRSRATRIPSRWCSAGCTRLRATTSRTFARRSRSSGSTTPRVTYEPETSGALGFGFRCGFLGLLHMDIVRERLEREFDLSLIATAPSVEYRAHLTDGTMVEVHSPSEMPEPQKLESSRSRTCRRPSSPRPSTPGL